MGDQREARPGPVVPLRTRRTLRAKESPTDTAGFLRGCPGSIPQSLLKDAQEGDPHADDSVRCRTRRGGCRTGRRRRFVPTVEQRRDRYSPRLDAAFARPYGKGQGPRGRGAAVVEHARRIRRFESRFRHSWTSTTVRSVSSRASSSPSRGRPLSELRRAREKLGPPQGRNGAFSRRHPSASTSVVRGRGRSSPSVAISS